MQIFKTCSYCLFFSFIGCSYVFHRDRSHLDKTGLTDKMFKSLNSPVTTKPSWKSDFRRKLRAMQVDTCKFFQIFVLPYLHIHSSQLSYKTVSEKVLSSPKEPQGTVHNTAVLWKKGQSKPNYLTWLRSLIVCSKLLAMCKCNGLFFNAKGTIVVQIIPKTRIKPIRKATFDAAANFELTGDKAGNRMVAKLESIMNSVAS